MPYPLLTERLSIAPLGHQDVDAFVGYRQDPEIARFQSWDTGYSREQALALVDSQVGVTLPAAGDWLQLAVHQRETGELLGDLALHSLEESPGEFELGFTLARQHQGHGYAREAAARLIGYVFDEVGATKMVATTDQRNASSIRLLMNLGFYQVPAKTWTEQFKGELVTVNFFELGNPLKEQP